MSYKPSDFYLGVIDLFGVLLPGVVLAALLSRWRSVLFDGLGVEAPTGQLWTVLAFFVAGYVLGHVLRALGEFLDRYVYDRFYVPAFKRRPRLSGFWEKTAHVGRAALDALNRRAPPAYQPDPLLAEAKRVADLDDPGEARRNTFSWADTYVRLADPAAHAATERLTADSKFFRSLSIVAAVAAGISLAEGALLLPAVLVVAVLFSIAQFLRLRWKATSALYHIYIQLRQRPVGAG